MQIARSEGMRPQESVAAASAIAGRIMALDAVVDADGRYPAPALALLADAGLLVDPLPPNAGGFGIGMLPDTVAAAAALLGIIGGASLALGRLYEGHVNAVRLAAHYGGAAPLATIALAARSGAISGVWNAQRDAGLVATRVRGGWRLDGGKIFCSGAGHIAQPIVTAQAAGEDGPRMFLIDGRTPGVVADIAAWRAAGMRGSATGTVTFDGHLVPEDMAIGGPGDYYRAPLFAGGAWRVLAVQLGALERILALHVMALRESGRGGDAVVRARLADAAGDVELARLLTMAAAQRAEDAGGDPAARTAYVDLARTSFERLALQVIAATRRNVGLASFIAPAPLDRIIRDLETYLRQPFLDASRDHVAQRLLAVRP
ncbi:MAG: hypothetical protein RL490_2674 [Pseudomonadota bacterium]|jgi:alkylation response protein AidB-like acyl-CoA dehydrogenase